MLTLKLKTLIITPVLLIPLIGLSLWYSNANIRELKFDVNNAISQKETASKESLTTPTPTVNLPELPQSKLLPTDYHVFQTFNNCAPASLSMALRFYGINVSQEELGNALRPYQVPNGENDDKSVTLDELGEKAKEYGFIPYHRPMGNPQVVKQFIAQDIPVITSTWTKPNEDIGHVRVIKGYDESRGIFIQDDSLQGKNLEYTYADFNEIWKKFNYEYLVLVPKDKVKIVNMILAEFKDEKSAWQAAAENSEKELGQNPNDIYARFNLSVALYNAGDFEGSVREFEQVENQLPARTLWYQIEPIQAYYELGNFNRVFEISDKILNNGNRAFSELYLLRGKIYQKQGNVALARSEFEKAIYYNSNMKEARKALQEI